MKSLRAFRALTPAPNPSVLPPVRTLRHLREFFNVQFSVRPERESQTIFLSCVGSGLKNLSKRID